MATKVYIGTMRVKNEWFKLTPRQQEIALLVMQGQTNRQIANNLHVTEQTIKDHLHDVFEKVGARNRTELVLKLIESPGPREKGKT